MFRHSTKWLRVNNKENVTKYLGARDLRDITAASLVQEIFGYEQLSKKNFHNYARI